MPWNFPAMTPFDIFVQGVGFVAMAFGIGSYQAKKRGGILLMQVIASLLWVTQFVLLGQLTGAVLNGIAILRGLLYGQREKFAFLKSPLIPLVFCILFAIAGVLTVPGLFDGSMRWESFLLSMLPVCAMALSSYALSLTNERRIRIFSLTVSPPWLIYDAVCGSVAGVINESFVMVSILVALIRYRKRK